MIQRMPVRACAFILGLRDREVPEYWSLSNTPDFSGSIEVNREAILNGIKAKGGLYGRHAVMYMGDDKLADQFIMECAKQCQNKLAIKMWGQELALAIEEYSMGILEKTLI